MYSCKVTWLRKWKTNSDINLGNEYEESESDEENVISEDNSTSYLNTVKTEKTSSDDDEM